MLAWSTNKLKRLSNNLLTKFRAGGTVAPALHAHGSDEDKSAEEPAQLTVLSMPHAWTGACQVVPVTHAYEYDEDTSAKDPTQLEK